MKAVPRAEFKRRRRQLMRLMGRDSIAIVPAAPVRLRNSDVEYAYRQDSDFHYLTGFDERTTLGEAVRAAGGGEPHRAVVTAMCGVLAPAVGRTDRPRR